MKPELMWLVWSVALAFVQALVCVAGATLQVGLPMLAGNRENMPALTGWARRANRAHLNMLESLVLFAALVLVAVVSGKTNGTTLLGAQLFFWARLAYAPIYVVGIPWLRTLVWFVSVIGMVLIFLQLL
ncbi:MAG TPA: MAPEG family protein [Burkholderiales bacterium]|nr:MAPEG family protein [Burkholderiales bacterium]